jgi:hypothetical protein
VGWVNGGGAFRLTTAKAFPAFSSAPRRAAKCFDVQGQRGDGVRAFVPVQFQLFTFESGLPKSEMQNNNAPDTKMVASADTD